MSDEMNTDVSNFYTASEGISHKAEKQEEEEKPEDIYKKASKIKTKRSKRKSSDDVLTQFQLWIKTHVSLTSVLVLLLALKFLNICEGLNGVEFCIFP